MTSPIQELLSVSILDQSKVLTFNNNETIIQENQNLDYLFYILKGRAKIYHNTENGKTILLHFLNQNDWIGELTFLEIEEKTKYVAAIGTVEVLAIPKKIVTSKLLNDPYFLTELSQFIGKKLLERTNHLIKNQGYQLKYRLATLIIDLSHHQIYCEKHTTIVDYLGVSYRHLLQIFKEFQEEGYLEKIGHQTYIINDNKLNKLYIFNN